MRRVWRYARTNIQRIQSKRKKRMTAGTCIVVFYTRRTFFSNKGLYVLNWTTGNGITHQVGSSIHKPCCVYCIYTVHKESCRIKSKKKRSAHLRGPTNITFGWEDFLTKGHVYIIYSTYCSYSFIHIGECKILHYTQHIAQYGPTSWKVE